MAGVGRTVDPLHHPQLHTPATGGQPATQPFSAVASQRLHGLLAWDDDASSQVFSSCNGGFGTLTLQEWQCYTLPVDSHPEALRQIM